MLSIALDAETGQRGFLLTGEPRYLAPHQAAARLRQQIDTVARLTADNPAQQARIPELQRLAAIKLAELDEPLWVDGDATAGHVRDTGIGIARDLLPRVFDMFMQVDAGALDRGESGLGIGLTLVKQLVEMHEGTVAAHSDGPGRGSEFVVRLPPVALTGWGQEQDRRRAREAGFDRHLVEPVDPDALDALLRELVAGKQDA